MSKEPAGNAVSDIPDRLPLFLKSLLLPALAAAVGSTATARNVRVWYPTLSKPSWNPPGSIFGPVWTTLYLMMGIADYIVATQSQDEDARFARRIYKVQLGLNALWSVLFFGLRRPGMALVEIVFLWTAIMMTIVAFWRISRVAALLLVPYLLWTTFATALNSAIWYRNR
jgi:benzodiazapine receptor